MEKTDIKENIKLIFIQHNSNIEYVKVGFCIKKNNEILSKYIDVYMLKGLHEDKFNKYLKDIFYENWDLSTFKSESDHNWNEDDLYFYSFIEWENHIKERSYDLKRLNHIKIITTSILENIDYCYKYNHFNIGITTNLYYYYLSTYDYNLDSNFRLYGQNLNYIYGDVFFESIKKIEEWFCYVLVLLVNSHEKRIELIKNDFNIKKTQNISNLFENTITINDLKKIITINIPSQINSINNSQKIKNYIKKLENIENLHILIKLILESDLKRVNIVLKWIEKLQDEFINKSYIINKNIFFIDYNFFFIGDYKLFLITKFNNRILWYSINSIVEWLPSIKI